MWRFVLRENIAHLKLLISKVGDERTAGPLQAQLHDAERELAELAGLSAHADAAHDAVFAELLTDILRHEVELETANFGLMQLLEASSGSLHIAAQLIFQVRFLRHFEVVRPGDGTVYGKALSDGDGDKGEDIDTDERFASQRAVVSAAGFRAVFSLPLFRSSAVL